MYDNSRKKLQKKVDNLGGGGKIDGNINSLIEDTIMSFNWQSIAETPLQSGEDMRKQIVDKAISDESFRAELLSNPKSAISTELGLDLPEEMNIEVHESDFQTLHLSLPVTEMNEEQLEAVAAGRCCC